MNCSACTGRAVRCVSVSGAASCRAPVILCDGRADCEDGWDEDDCATAGGAGGARYSTARTVSQGATRPPGWSEHMLDADADLPSSSAAAGSPGHSSTPPTGDDEYSVTPPVLNEIDRALGKGLAHVGVAVRKPTPVPTYVWVVIAVLVMALGFALCCYIRRHMRLRAEDCMTGLDKAPSFVYMGGGARRRPSAPVVDGVLRPTPGGAAAFSKPSDYAEPLPHAGLREEADEEADQIYADWGDVGVRAEVDLLVPSLGDELYAKPNRPCLRPGAAGVGRP